MVEGRETVGENGVQIGEQHDGSLMRFAKAADQLNGVGGGHTGLERALGSHLVDDAIGERIGKRQAEFDDIGPGICQGFDDFQRGFKIRITRGDVGDEGFLVGFTELGEGGVDAVGHWDLVN